MKKVEFAKNKNQKNKGKKKFQFRYHWWYVPIGIAVVLIVGIGAVYFRINSAILSKTKLVANWNDAMSTASGTSSDENLLDSIDAGNFAAGNSKDYPIIKVKQKNPDVENILLIGIDGDKEGGVGVNRADSMIVASLNSKSKTLKLASLLRDTKTYFPNTKSYHKLNAAYSYGGPGLQIDVINYAYKLDVQKYIQIDFSGFQHIIDTVGGVQIKLTAKEAASIGVGSKAGTYELDGAHALAYSRTREIDTEFMRTQRQRNVMLAIYAKFKDVGVQKKLSIANTCLNYVKTNIPTSELLGSLMTFESSMNSNIQQIAIPTEGDGMYTTETTPIWYWDLDWSKEVPRLQNFLYGK